MKKTLVVAIALIASLTSFSQTKPNYDGEFLNINVENGVGVEQKLKFSLSKDDYDKISSSEMFKNWRERTWANPANAKFIELNKGIDETVVYLKGHITMCKFDLKFTKLKNGESLEFIENSKGSIYLSENGGVRISFPFKAQNGYGNYVMSKTIYSVDYNNGKEKTDCYVY